MRADIRLLWRRKLVWSGRWGLTLAGLEHGVVLLFAAAAWAAAQVYVGTRLYANAGSQVLR